VRRSRSAIISDGCQSGADGGGSAWLAAPIQGTALNEQAIRSNGWLVDRPFYGLKRFSTTIAKHLNDLPITSPHGSDFDATCKLLKLHQFERSTPHSEGTPRQVLHHPQRLSGYG
jgi:hypothetical protein